MSSESRYLSLVLRHKPEVANVQMDAHGWVDIQDLIRGSRGRLTRDTVQEAVATDPKGRFALSPDGKKIRATQGHSVPVDLELVAVEPPTFLYHGTTYKVFDAIRRDGIKKMDRHHVHLAEELGTAESIGIRKGSPVVFRIRAKDMHEFGHKFYRSENGVWLVDFVPPDFVTQERA